MKNSKVIILFSLFVLLFNTVKAQKGTSGSSILSNKVILNGTGLLNFPSQSIIPDTPVSGFSLFANSTNALSWKGANGFTRTFDGTANTANQIYNLQNSSGIVPLLESTQTWSGTNTFNGISVLSGNVGIGINTIAGFKLDVNGTARFSGNTIASQYNLLALNIAPTSAIAVGTTGEIRWANGFVYLCVATNTWQRSALTTW